MKKTAEEITRYVNKIGYTADSLHGKKTQNAREAALKNFKN